MKLLPAEITKLNTGTSPSPINPQALYQQSKPQGTASIYSSFLHLFHRIRI